MILTIKFLVNVSSHRERVTRTGLIRSIEFEGLGSGIKTKQLHEDLQLGQLAMMNLKAFYFFSLLQETTGIKMTNSL